MITLASVAEETSGLSPDPIDEVRAVQRYATGTKNAVGMGSMLRSGAAAVKPGPAYMARAVASIVSPPFRCRRCCHCQYCCSRRRRATRPAAGSACCARPSARRMIRG